MESNIEKAVDDIKLGTVEDRIETAQKINSAMSMEQFKFNLDKWSERFTPEYLEQLSKNSYNQDRAYPENFSNWYYHIIDFGAFKTPKVESLQVFTWEETELICKDDFFDNVNWNVVENILKPTLDKLNPHKYYHIKNGAFSNKFDFSTCVTTKKDLAKNFWKIQYQSALFDTGGYTELVVRELIPSNIYEIPTIYNGMPLREEIRVFYNMNTNKIEYMVDYWDYKYCREHINEKTDQIVFDWFHNQLGGRTENHQDLVYEICQKIQSNIDTLKFDGVLDGIWSIDFMYVNETSDIYLIDMARGNRSAYWDIDKCSKGV